MIKSTSNPIDNLLTQLLTQRSVTDTSNVKNGAIANQQDQQKSTDIVVLSQEAQSDGGQAKNTPQQNMTEIDNGYRREQSFETADGRSFTRIEEITTTPERTRRVVIQQNDSGSTTASETVIDRLDDGSFRQVQRFTDEMGDTKTNVELNFNPEDANIILGRNALDQFNSNNNNTKAQSLRGSQIDISA